MRVRVFGLAGFILTSTLVLDGGSSSYVWDGSVDNDWFKALNWTPSAGAPPGPSDTATINSLTVDISGNTDVEVAFLNMNGGTLTGNATITVTGNLDWTGGDFGGSGNVDLTNTAALLISGGDGGRDLNERTFNQAGTTVFEPSDTVRMGDGAVFNNQVDALFEIKTDQSFDYNNVPPEPTLNNLGTLRKSMGNGTSTIDIAVNNSSPVEVQTGRLRLTRGGNSSGDFTVSAGGILDFGGGTHSIALADGKSMSGAGTVRFSAGTTNISGNGDYNVTGVTEVTGGTVNFNRDANTVNTLLSAGILAGSGLVTVTGNLDWTGGDFDGSGNLDLTDAVTFTISGGAGGRDLNERTLNSAGTTVFEPDDTVNMGEGALFNNQVGALFEIKTDRFFDYNNLPPEPTFSNLGTVRKSAGTGTSTFDIAFNSDDTVEVETGTLDITRGGSSDASFEISGNATFRLSSSYSLNDGATFSGAGTLKLNSGLTTVTGEVSAVTVEHDGADLIGSGNLTVSDTYDWVSGDMDGSGSTTMPNTGTLNIGGGDGGRDLNERTFNQAGTTVFEPSDTVRMGDGAVFNNQVGALFEIKTDQSFDYNNVPPEPTLNNLGTLRKSMGNGTSTIDIAVNNSSPVEVQTGRLRLTRGGNSSGDFTVSAGGILDFGGGTHSIALADGKSMSGAGTVRFSAGTTNISGNGDYNVTGVTEVTGGTVNFNRDANTVNGLLSAGILAGSGLVTVTGNLDWTGGDFDGSGNLDLTDAVTFTISGGAGGRDLNERTLNSAGTTVFEPGDTVRMGQGALFDNQVGALFEIKTDRFFDYNNLPPEPTFSNLGTVRKSAGTGTSTFDIAFNSDDTVEVETGTLDITRGGSSDASFEISGNATFRLSSSYSLNDGATFSGAGTLKLNSGLTTVTGEVSAVTVEHDGADLIGSGNLTVSDTYDWVSGDMDGSGSTTMPNTGTLNIGGGDGGRDLNERTFNQAGTTVFEPSDTVRMGDGAVFNNQVGALFEIKTDQSFDYNNVPPEPTLNNLGTLRKVDGQRYQHDRHRGEQLQSGGGADREAETYPRGETAAETSR